MLQLLKQKNQVAYAKIERKKFKALMPDEGQNVASSFDFAAELKKLPKTDARRQPLPNQRNE